MTDAGRRIALLAAGVALVAFLGLLAGAAAIGVEDSAFSVQHQHVSTPSEEVEIDGETFVVSSIALLDAGEDLTVDVDVPEGEPWALELRDRDENVVDSWTRIGSGEYTLDMDASADAYVLALEVDGSFQDIQPIVVEGYDLEVEHADNVTQDEPLVVTVELSYGERETDPGAIEVVAFNADDDLSEATATQIDDGVYQAELWFDDLPIGSYQVYASATDGSDDRPAVWAVEGGSSVAVEESEDDDDGDDADDDDGDDADDNNGDDADDDDGDEADDDDGDDADDDNGDEADDDNGDDADDDNGDDADDDNGDDADDDNGEDADDDNGDEADDDNGDDASQIQEPAIDGTAPDDGEDATPTPAVLAILALAGVVATLVNLNRRG